MIRFSIILALIFSFYFNFGQITNNVYVLEFTDKNNSPYSTSSPEAFLSQRTIERRNKQNINIKENDIPVNPAYINEIVNAGDIQVKYTSKWFNCILIQTEDTFALDTILNKPFVKSLKKQELNFPPMENDKFMNWQYKTDTYNSTEYGKGLKQINDINVHLLHRLGHKGDGLLIGIFDAGYNNANKMLAFQHLWNNDQIIGSKDFVTGNDLTYTKNNHGTWVLSIMAGYLPNEFTGSAPNANYWLYITENTDSETLLEEYNWLAAAEHADSIGVDIINSSLAYTTFDDTTQNHTHAQLDGKTAVISRAATIAASKGILVVSSAGNYANGNWRKIGFPADADSILTIGAIGNDSSYASFSSVGYTADNRVKPDITATGKGIYVISAKDEVFSGNGTSFSSPLIAGSMACLWQYAPNTTNIDLISTIQQSASQYNSPDSLMGYGIPDFYKAMTLLAQNQQLDELLNDSLVISPNPTLENCTLTYFTNYIGNATITITDLLGNNISSQLISLSSGINKFNLYLNDLSIGTYVITLNNEETSVSQKLIKL